MIQAQIYLIIISFSLVSFLNNIYRKLFPNAAAFKIMVSLAAVFFNPYTFKLMGMSIVDSLQQISLLVFLSGQIAYHSNSKIIYILIGCAAAINPTNVIFAFQAIIYPKNKSKTTSTLIFMVSSILIACLIQIISSQQFFSRYQQLYFPGTFKPQLNSTWIMSAHMFRRYISLYQIILVFAPIAALYLVNHMVITIQLKLVILLLIKNYCSIQCSELCIFFEILIEVTIFCKYLSKLLGRWNYLENKFEVIKITILTMIVVAAHICLYPVNIIFLHKYLNDFTINMGYLMIYFSVYWAFKAVYLSEIVNSSIKCHRQLTLQKQKNQTIKKQHRQ